MGLRLRRTGGGTALERSTSVGLREGAEVTRGTELAALAVGFGTESMGSVGLVVFSSADSSVWGASGWCADGRCIGFNPVGSCVRARSRPSDARDGLPTARRHRNDREKTLGRACSDTLEALVARSASSSPTPPAELWLLGLRRERLRRTNRRKRMAAATRAAPPDARPTTALVLSTHWPAAVASGSATAVDGAAVGDDSSTTETKEAEMLPPVALESAADKTARRSDWLSAKSVEAVRLVPPFPVDSTAHVTRMLATPVLFLPPSAAAQVGTPTRERGTTSASARAERNCRAVTDLDWEAPAKLRAGAAPESGSRWTRRSGCGSRGGSGPLGLSPGGEP